MTYSIEENHHSGLELYFMPRFFVYNPCCAEPHTHEFYQIIWFRRGHGTHHVYMLIFSIFRCLKCKFVYSAMKSYWL